jgi:hypothetical protein
MSEWGTRLLQIKREGKAMPDQCTDTSACSAITEEQISKRAYELWEARGYPQGNGSDDWQAAKAQLLAENRHSLSQASHAGVDLTAASAPTAHGIMAHGESGPTRRRGLLSRWMGLLKKAG